MPISLRFIKIKIYHHHTPAITPVCYKVICCFGWAGIRDFCIKKIRPIDTDFPPDSMPYQVFGLIMSVPQEQKVINFGQVQTLAIGAV